METECFVCYRAGCRRLTSGVASCRKMRYASHCFTEYGSRNSSSSCRSVVASCSNITRMNKQ